MRVQPKSSKFKLDFGRMNWPEIKEIASTYALMYLVVKLYWRRRTTLQYYQALYKPDELDECNG